MEFSTPLGTRGVVEEATDELLRVSISLLDGRSASVTVERTRWYQRAHTVVGAAPEEIWTFTYATPDEVVAAMIGRLEMESRGLAKGVSLDRPDAGALRIDEFVSAGGGLGGESAVAMGAHVHHGRELRPLTLVVWREPGHGSVLDASSSTLHPLSGEREPLLHLTGPGEATVPELFAMVLAVLDYRNARARGVKDPGTTR
jgi:hypothetical protein